MGFPIDYFKHPELALALAKTGCDLVLLPMQQGKKVEVMTVADAEKWTPQWQLTRP